MGKEIKQEKGKRTAEGARGEKRADDRKKLGSLGEERACAYLTHCGYKVLERNFRCRSGEIDVIAAQGGNTICFIEVKTRRGLRYGMPAEAVDHRKREKLLTAASYYLLCHPEYRSCAARMDVIELLIRGGSSYVRHIENAFQKEAL